MLVFVGVCLRDRKRERERERERDWIKSNGNGLLRPSNKQRKKERIFKN